MPGRLLLTLAAAGCLWALGYVLWHVLRGGRSRAWQALAGLSMLAGVAWAGANLALFSGRVANLAAAVVTAAFLFGLPSVPLAIGTALARARAGRKRRARARDTRAAEAVRAWRDRRTAGRPPPADRPTDDENSGG